MGRVPLRRSSIRHLPPRANRHRRRLRGPGPAGNDQKNADRMKSVIASDAFGVLIDSNAAELLESVPGLAMNYAGAGTRSDSTYAARTPFMSQASRTETASRTSASARSPERRERGVPPPFPLAPAAAAETQAGSPNRPGKFEPSIGAANHRSDPKTRTLSVRLWKLSLPSRDVFSAPLVVAPRLPPSYPPS